MPLELPPRPEIMFGVWDRFTLKPATSDTYSGQVGYKIHPNYYGYGRNIYQSLDQIPLRALEAETAAYDRNLHTLLLRNLKLHEFLQDKVILSMQYARAGWYPHFHIMVEGHEEALELRTNRSNWNTPTIETEGEFPKTVKRWLKSGKTVRFTDGTSALFHVNGRLQIERVPRSLLNELYGIT